MSHLTKVKTKISNLIQLKQALKDLNLDFSESTEHEQQTIKSWHKENQEVILAIKGFGQYHVGVVLNQEDNTYEFVADWWGVESYTNMDQQQFINKITQKYAYNTVMDKIREKGYELVSEKVDDKQQLNLVLRKWN